jgi:eukaryotic-like serine/threonine-protein kinase
LSIAACIAQALQYLHQKKLVHRDVKPANIFIPESSGAGLQPLAKLGDFGIMKWGDFQASISTGTLTVTSQQGLGTLKYMSPEQAIAPPREVTVRSDIYSFGIALFRIVHRPNTSFSPPRVRNIECPPFEGYNREPDDRYGIPNS